MTSRILRYIRASVYVSCGWCSNDRGLHGTSCSTCGKLNTTKPLLRSHHVFVSQVGLKGATCTLNETTDEVVNDSNSLLKMYAGMGAIPTVLSFTAFSILGAPWNNFHIGLTPTTFLYGLGVASVATYALMRYLDLHNTEILVGKCPCCETPIKQLFSGSEPADSFVQNCPVCGTSCSISRKDKRMSLASGPDFIKA